MHFNSSESGRGESTTSDELKSALLSALSVKFKREEKRTKTQTGRKKRDDAVKKDTKDRGGRGIRDPGKMKQVANKRRRSKWKQEKS